MTRLLSAQVEAQQKRILDATSDIIGDNIGALRGEIAQKQNERTADVQRIKRELLLLKLARRRALSPQNLIRRCALLAVLVDSSKPRLLSACLPLLMVLMALLGLMIRT